MNNTATQTLENMPSEPSLTTLTRLASDDYIRNLPDDFWSPVFGQTANRSSAYQFNFDLWHAHYDARKASMQTFFETWLAKGGAILQSFSDDRPTIDFTEEYRNGCPDILWNTKGTRRVDLHGTISPYEQPFLAPYMTPTYLAEHLACRMFGFNMRVATYLEFLNTKIRFRLNQNTSGLQPSKPTVVKTRSVNIRTPQPCPGNKNQ